jgi:23S rRNA pseudouridine1911/1915/1917 synthase
MTAATTAMPSTMVSTDSRMSHCIRARNCACSGLNCAGELSSPVSELVMSKAGARVETAVGAAEAGERLDRVLAAHMAADVTATMSAHVTAHLGANSAAADPMNMSRSRLKALILAGRVTVGGRTIRDPSHRVNAGDAIAVEVPPVAPAVPAAENIALSIIHEDDDIIVIDKPAGLVVHPAAGNWTGTLVNALIAHCGESLSGIGGVRRPGIVHRLDKDTTGLMVVAKNDRAHRVLAAQFADHGRTGPLRRSYLALVWGAPDRPLGVIDKPIRRHPKARERMAVVTGGEGDRSGRGGRGGREAVTQWQILTRYPDGAAVPAVSLLDCSLKTGRTHQIRVHLASIGHPLLGDAVYGAGFKTKVALLPKSAAAALAALSRQALHAYLLVVQHPATGEEMVFRSAPPLDVGRVFRSLGMEL